MEENGVSFPVSCPNCGAPLAPAADGTRYVCPHGHSFDVSRQGYVNFLLPNHGGARDPGDSREMVASRTRFLESGAYRALSDAVTAAVLASAGTAEGPLLAADAGCGEGYYTNRLCEALQAKGRPYAAVGFDLSKYAVSHAARAARSAGLHALFGVASLFEMPVLAESFGVILNLFAPCAPEAFARALAPGGILLAAVPAERHLFELKERLYETPYENEPRRDVLPGFSAPAVTTVRDSFTVGAQRADLLRMTPYYWHTPRDAAERFLSDEEPFSCTAAFDLLLYRKL